MDITFNCPLSVEDLSNNHCAVCQHKLIDCTRKSDQEIISLASQSEKFCGIFKASQISNRNRSFNQALFKIAFVFVFVLGLNEAKASCILNQDTPTSHASFENTTVSDTLEKQPVLQGVIKDDAGELIPFAKIVVETSNGVRFMAVSDLNGAYKISLVNIPEGTLVSVHVISYGLQSVKIINVPVELITTVDVTMKAHEEMIIIGLIISPQLIPSDPYDFGKHKVVIEEER